MCEGDTTSFSLHRGRERAAQAMSGGESTSSDRDLLRDLHEDVTRVLPTIDALLQDESFEPGAALGGSTEDVLWRKDEEIRGYDLGMMYS